MRGRLRASFSAGRLALLSAVSIWGASFLVTKSAQIKKMPSEHDAVVSTTAGVGGALLFLVPLALVELILTGAPELSGEGIAAIGYLGALSSAVAYWLWNHALTEMDASLAAPYLNLIPALAVLLALVVGERVAPEQLLGGAVVALGVWLSGKGARRRGRRPEADGSFA